jgi:hypothetical protein
MVVGGGFAGKLHSQGTHKNNKNQCFIMSFILNHIECIIRFNLFLLCSVRNRIRFSNDFLHGRFFFPGVDLALGETGLLIFRSDGAYSFSTFIQFRPQNRCFFN